MTLLNDSLVYQSISNKLLIPHTLNILSLHYQQLLLFLGNDCRSRLSKSNHQQQGRGEIPFIQVRERCVLLITKNLQVTWIGLIICWSTSITKILFFSIVESDEQSIGDTLIHIIHIPYPKYILSPLPITTFVFQVIVAAVGYLNAITKNRVEGKSPSFR